MLQIAGLPGTYDRYASFILVELEKRTATGAGTYASTFYRYCNAPQNITFYSSLGVIMGLTLNVSTNATLFTRNSFGKNAGRPDGWDEQAYASVGFTSSGFVSFQMDADTQNFIIVGLNSDPTTDASYTSIDYAWYCQDGTCFVYESGASILNAGTYTASTVFAVAYDGTNIYYLKDGVIQRTVVRAVGATLYLDSSFYRQGRKAINVTYSVDGGFPTSGSTFTARGFPPPTVVQDGNLGNSTSFTFADFDNLFKTLALNNDMLDWWVRVWEVGVDVNYAPKWIKMKLTGRTEDLTWNVRESDDFQMDAGTSGAVTATSGIREVYSASCRFVREFCRGRCAASSVAALAALAAGKNCDGQLSTCISYSNDTRYGGFPDALPPGTALGVWGEEVQFDSRQIVILRPRIE